MLVMKGSQQPRPSIGFNVTECVVINSQKKQTNDVEEEKLIKTMKMFFPNLKKRTVKAFIKAVSVEQPSEYLVSTSCQKMSILSHSGSIPGFSSPWLLQSACLASGLGKLLNSKLLLKA